MINLWYAAKTLLREGFIALNIYIEKKKDLNNLSFQLNKREKEEHIKFYIKRKENNKDKSRNYCNIIQKSNREKSVE